MKWLRLRRERAGEKEQAAREGLEEARRQQTEALRVVEISRNLRLTNGFAEGVGQAMGVKR